MQEEYIIRILLAALVGGVIGFEREYHDKSAGFRTMILIATGSAFFTILSLEIGESVGDNARIAAAVVSVDALSKVVLIYLLRNYTGLCLDTGSIVVSKAPSVCGACAGCSSKSNATID